MTVNIKIRIRDSTVPKLVVKNIFEKYIKFGIIKEMKIPNLS